MKYVLMLSLVSQTAFAATLECTLSRKGEETRSVTKQLSDYPGASIKFALSNSTDSVEVWHSLDNYTSAKLSDGTSTAYTSVSPGLEFPIFFALGKNNDSSTLQLSCKKI